MIRTLLSWRSPSYPLLWRGATILWLMSLVLSVFPDVAKAEVIDIGDLRFNFSQVVILLAVGFAWGDMRQWRASADERMKRLEKHDDDKREEGK